MTAASHRRHNDKPRTRAKNERAHCIRRIQRLITPKLRASGFQTGPLDASTPLLLCTWQDALTAAHPHRGFVLTSSLGFVADGVITDAFGGGLTTLRYAQLPLEDLMMLEDHIRDHLEELT